MKKHVFDRMMGSIYGLVVGDCLGAYLEFSDKDKHEYICDYKSGGAHRLRAGDWTDDTAMALAVIDSIGELGKVDKNDIMNRFADWMLKGKYSSNGICFDIGFGTRSAIIDFLSDRNQNLEYQPRVMPESKGNGSIMRLAPSVIYSAVMYDYESVLEISRLTHNNKEVDDVVEDMAFEVMIPQMMMGDKVGFQSFYKNRFECSNSGRAIDTFHSALWAFQSTKNFEDGMVEAVNLGGDSDTIGAVYGQIAGSYYGYSQIPRRWLDGIIDKFYIDKLVIDMNVKLGISMEK